MVRRWVYICGVMIVMLISNTQTAKENCNKTKNIAATNIAITDSKTMNKIDDRQENRSSATSDLLATTPSEPHQGNNIFIKPKFIFGSPFTSHKHGYSPSSSVSVASKVLDSELHTLIATSEVTHLPTKLAPLAPPVVIPTGIAHDIPIPLIAPPVSIPAGITDNIPTPFIGPPVIIPAGIAGDIPIPFTAPRVILPASVAHDISIPFAAPPVIASADMAHDIPISFSAPPIIVPAGIADDIQIPFTTIQSQPHVPFAIPNICQSVACPPDVIPLPLYFPQLPMAPNLIEEPINPLVIPEPPNLPPVVLPDLPIEVTVQKPSIPNPGHHTIISPYCIPTPICDSDEPTVASILNEIYQKFKTMVGAETNIKKTEERNSTTKSVPPFSYPALCAQGIITERFIPNIVPNEEIKVQINPISTSQLAHFNYYRK